MHKTAESPDRRFAYRPMAIALQVTLALVAGPAAAQLVTSLGDVSPSFVEAASVNLAGQRVFIGFTNGAVGTQGTLSVTGGGSLTAAQIVPGIGGLGIGTVTVDGLGSIVNLTGGASNNGLDIGSWGSGTMTVSKGATVACSSPLACPYSSIGNGAGSTGLLTINGGVLSGFGSFAVGTGNLSAGFGTAGAPTSATLNILNDGTRGGSLATTGYSSVASNSGQAGLVTGIVKIDGAGSNWTITRDLANGGGQAFLALAPAGSASANATISNSGKLTVTGSRSSPATDGSLPGINMSTAAGARSMMTVTTGGSVLIGGDSGVITLGGNASTSSAGAKATLNITEGGKVSGTGLNGLMFMAIGQNLGEGIVNVSGAGSQLTVAGVGGQNTQGLDGLGGLVIVGRNRNSGGGGIGTLSVTDGGSVLISDNGLAASTGSMGLRLAQGAGSSGTVNVSGPGSSIVVTSTGGSATTPDVQIGQGGVGKMTVEDGGAVLVQGIGQRNFIVGNSSTGSGTLDVKTGAQINASWFAVGNNGGSGTATINNASVNLDGVVYFNGNPLGAGARVGRGVGSDSVLNLENGAALNIDNSIADASVILGGTGAVAGGKGTLNMSGGSTINFTGSAANASLQVGGSSGGNGVMSMTGNSNVNMGLTGGAFVGGPAGSDGKLKLESGSKLGANSINIGGNSDTAGALGGTGTTTVTGLGSELIASGASGFIGVGRNGTGSLTVAGQGKVSAIALSVGRSAGGNGQLTVNNGTINLAGQQTSGNQVGASMGVGLGGATGAASFSNASQLNITNLGSAGASLGVGGNGLFPGGIGTLSLDGASQIKVTAATGAQANVNVGRDGTGAGNLSGGSSISVGSEVGNVFSANGNVYVGREAGGVGTLNLSGGSRINAGFVGIGVGSAGVGNALGTPGGTGTLTLNDSTINTLRFELGVNGLLTGNNGVINVADSVNPINGQTVKGPVVIGGTISPGTSPGRLRINCDLTMLSGSKLILEIDDNGVSVDIDQLIIGEDSNFDLFRTQIIFSFLGSTNPEQVDLNLNQFLRAGATGSNATTDLQRLFKVGDDWNDVVNSTNFAFQSSVYDVTRFEFNAATGGITGVEASAIPEPATYAMVLLALAAMLTLSRRRAVRRL